MAVGSVGHDGVPIVAIETASEDVGLFGGEHTGANKAGWPVSEAVAPRAFLGPTTPSGAVEIIELALHHSIPLTNRMGGVLGRGQSAGVDGGAIRQLIGTCALIANGRHFGRCQSAAIDFHRDATGSGNVQGEKIGPVGNSRDVITVVRTVAASGIVGRKVVKGKSVGGQRWICEICI